MKRVTNLLPILLAWCFAFSANAQCPNSLSGYTLLGEFGDSKYFISNSSTNWNTAKNNASSNGGYLASITSQGENNFIQSKLNNNIVFIGFNDAQSEGNFKWDSGESVGFSKFTGTNASDKDFGKMNFWNGNWDVDNQYVSRKSIVEVPCGGGGGGGGGGGDCPNSVSGFTTIGEFGDSKYYRSNSNAKPADAQAVAASNGGYLAVISSQGENNFIQQNINTMTYIGLNDAASEGNLKWVNGESLSYNNVDPCGFCEENSGSKDYVIMAPWNGKWSFSSQFNSRPYIMEIPCDGGGGSDECSFTSTIPLGFSGFGSSLRELRETNAGYELVSNDILSGATRRVLETTVNKDNGSVAGSNFVQNDSDVGFPNYWDRDANEIYTASLVGSSPSNSFTITKKGASNNTIFTKTISVGFDIWGVSGIVKLNNEILVTFSSGPTTSFGVVKTDLNGNLAWAKNLDEGVEFGTGATVVGESSNGGYYIQYTNGGPFVIKLSSGSGTKLWKIDVGTGDPPSERRFILGESANGQYFYMANSSFNNFKASVTRFNTSNGNGTLIPLGQGLPTGTTQERSFFSFATPTNDGGVVVFFGYTPDVFGTVTYYHSRFDASGNLVWRRETPTSLPFDFNFNLPLRMIAAEDGGFILAKEINDDFIITRMTSDGFFEPDCDTGGGGNKPDLDLANLDNVPSSATPNSVVNFEFDLKNIGNATATNSYIIGAYISSDNNLSSDDFLSGEVPTANTVVGTDANVPGAITVPNILVSGTYYLILKADINNAINESNENNNTISRQIFIDTGGGGGSCNNPPTISGFTFKTSVGNKAYYLSNSSNRPTDAQNKCTQAGGNLATVNNATINNALKPFTSGLVYIGLHDDNTEGNLQWRSGSSVSYTNFDNCSICEPNSGSKDYVAMQGWNGKWSWSSLYNSRKYWLEVDCNNLNSNNNSTLIVLPTNEERELLDFQKIVPNPASNHIFVQVKSETEMAIDIEVYDARGVLLKTQPAELFDGINAVEIDIADLPGGFYLVKIPQMKGQYAVKRFVKVRK